MTEDSLDVTDFRCDYPSCPCLSFAEVFFKDRWFYLCIHHKKLLERWRTPNIAGKVRDLACMGYLKRVGKGMYFYGPKLAQPTK